MPKSYLFAVMQYEKHPKTGEVLLTEEQIKKCIAHKTIGKWAYICHDKDVYSEKDEIDDPEKIAGTPKPRHWHIVLRTKTNQLEIGVIAKWLGIKENYIEIKPATAFLDLIEYLTHEHPNQQELGKHNYADEEIIANFDFRGMLDQRKENSLKYGRSEISKLDQWIFDLNQGNKTLRQCYLEDPILFGNNEEKLNRNRKIFLKMQKPPRARTNVYVGAKRNKNGSSGGVGKSLATRAVARQMAKSLGYFDMDDDDIMFIVGAKNVTFEGYDGQPIIIWDDCKAYNILEKLGSRENVYNVFDTYPAPIVQRQNIKGSYVPMNQVCNIISSSQSPIEFLDGLAGEYKTKKGEVINADDKSQIYRRINIYLFLHEEDYEMAFNKGYFDGNDNYYEYYHYRNLVGNFEQVRKRLDEQQALMIEDRMTKKIGEKMTEKLKREAEQKTKSRIEDFSLYGRSEDELREELVEKVEELKEVQEGLKNGTIQFRDDLTMDDVEEVKEKMLDVFSEFYKQLDDYGLIEKFEEFIKKSQKSRALDKYYEIHKENPPIPCGKEFEEEIEQLELDLSAMENEFYDEAKKRSGKNKDK